MRLYNTKSRKIEKVQPIEKDRIRLYTCGPTVYDYAHIGNLRTYVFEDILRRALEMEGYEVKHVMNVTDVDDKTIKVSRGEKTKFKRLTKKYEDSFFSDLKKLNIKKAETVTNATKYIEKMVLFVSDLLDKRYAYKGRDGSIYYSIRKFKDYGKLSHLNLDELKVGARVSQDEYSKDNPADFALWKAWDEKDGEIYWETKLGKGRPGWHIECSTMSQDVLGEQIDIHTGGVDNIFPHHENEIAQSEARTGKKFVNIWVHGEHLLVDGKKMAKSAGNFYKLSDIEKEGFSPLDFRYLCIQSHYRSKLNFTWEALSAARNARLRLISKINVKKNNNQFESKLLDQFKKNITNDLNTPEALAVAWEMIRDEKLSAEEKTAIFFEMDKVLKIYEDVRLEIPEEIQKLADERDKARADRDFKKADELRNRIAEKGFKVEDTIKGSKISR